MAKETLDRAHKKKDDEFYTKYRTIEDEINRHLDLNGNLFKDKVVYCNCDSYQNSNFPKIFQQNFGKLELKNL